MKRGGSCRKAAFRLVKCHRRRKGLRLGGNCSRRRKKPEVEPEGEDSRRTGSEKVSVELALIPVSEKLGPIDRMPIGGDANSKSNLTSSSRVLSFESFRRDFGG
uniref:Uncharacterized protein n=1 Tax=Nelumbo nucifera TaxID=4432 RepID=A0A822YA90_NELNU|nr:TPA_asm: hypothetical protein HUJ06_030958 [Nelumbo nucifera]